MTAWTAPRTWVTSEIVTAAMLNTHVRDNTLYLKGNGDVQVSIEGPLMITSASNRRDTLNINGITEGGAITGIAIGRSSGNNRHLVFDFMSFAGAHTWEFLKAANSNDLKLSEVGGSDAVTWTAGGNIVFARTVTNSGTTQLRFQKDFAVNSSLFDNAAIVTLSTSAQKPAYGFHCVGAFGGALYMADANTLRFINNGGTDVLLWHSGNDGTGSGLDADLLDNLNSTAFAQLAASNNTFAGMITTASAGSGGYRFSGSAGEYVWNSGANSLDMVSGGNRQGFWAGGAGQMLWVDNTCSVGSFTNRCDESLKTNIQATDQPVTERMRNLRAVSFRLRRDDGHVHHGFVAQEVQAHFPELIRVEKNPLQRYNPESDMLENTGEVEDLLSVDVIGLITKIYEYTREMDARLQAVEAK